jgi:hypothetical protein
MNSDTETTASEPAEDRPLQRWEQSRPVLGRDVGAPICELLGIDPAKAKSVSLQFDPGSMAAVTIKWFPSASDLARLALVFTEIEAEEQRRIDSLRQAKYDEHETLAAEAADARRESKRLYADADEMAKRAERLRADLGWSPKSDVDQDGTEGHKQAAPRDLEADVRATTAEAREFLWDLPTSSSVGE